MKNKDYTDLANNLEILMTSMNKFKKTVRCSYDTGLFKTHYGIIYLLYKFPAITMSQFSEKLGLPKPRVTIIVDKLVKEGIVKRELDENDRRIINIVLTEKGRDVFETIQKQRIENIKNVILKLNDNEINEFENSIKSLIKFIDKLV